MAWYSKLLPTFKKQSHNPEAKALVTVNPIPRQSWMDLEASGYTHRDQPYVALALDTISEICAGAGYGVYTQSAGEWVEVSDHPFTQLLRQPNPIDSDFELLQRMFQQLDAFGNAYWWLAGDGDGMPSEIWTIPPARMRIEPDAKTRVKNYVYEHAGMVRQFHHLEVVHFARPHLDDDFYGKPLVKAAQNEIESDILMARFQRDFFNKGVALPAGAFLVPSSLSDDRYEEFKTELSYEHGAGKRKTLVARASVGDEKLEYLRMGFDYQEMEFIKSREANRQVILERMGMPLGLLSENANEAHARVAERRLAANCYYRMMRVARRITKDILPFYGDGFEFRFEDVRWGDATQLQAMVNASQGVLSPDEQRQKYFGLEPLEGNGNESPSMDGAKDVERGQGRGTPDRLHERTEAR